MHQPELPRLPKKLRLLPLIGATYFMVAGGPYGLEDVLGKAGYGRALLLLLIVPILWSLPTALMVGELAAAIPAEGGYYIWVRRALGPFWGFQNAWLSITASVFDMAIYPVIFVSYLSRIMPAFGHTLATDGTAATLWALAVVLGCLLWNLRGAHSVGDASLWLAVPLLVPFVVLVAAGLWLGLVHHAPGGGLHALTAPSSIRPDLAGALAVCMFSYMGWDNASTVAQEVEDPQRNYPRAMLLAALATAVSYILPLAAVAVAGFPAERFSTGAWTDAAHALLPGRWGLGLSAAVVAGGMISGVGLFNALMLSYTRVPYALAEHGLLPRAFTRVNRAGVPWVSVVVLAIAWSAALRISFEGLVSIDVHALRCWPHPRVPRPRRPAPPRTRPAAPFPCPWRHVSSLGAGRDPHHPHHPCPLRHPRGARRRHARPRLRRDHRRRRPIPISTSPPPQPGTPFIAHLGMSGFTNPGAPTAHPDDLIPHPTP